MQKQSVHDYFIFAIRTFAGCVFVLVLVYLFYFLITKQAPLFNQEEVTVLKDWTYYAEDGTISQVESPWKPDFNGNTVCTYETRLPDYFPDNSVISFLNNVDIQVYVDGEEIYKWSIKEAPVFGVPAKNSYVFIPLKNEYRGKSFRIVRGTTSYKGKIYDAYVGERDSVVRALEIENGLLKFMLSVFLLLLSILIIAACIIFKYVYKTTINLTYIAYGILVTSTWLVVDSFDFQFVFRQRFIDSFTAYMCTLLLIFPFVSYLNELQNRRYSKVYLIILIPELISLVVFPILHISEIFSFPLALGTIDTILGVGIAATFSVTVYDIVKKRAESYKYATWGFVVFMVFCVLELLVINMGLADFEGMPTLVGLYILLTFGITQQISDIQRIQFERDMASAAANAKTTFLANMSHEIRTPINSILGMNEMILRESDDENITSYASMISESGQLLLSIVNDILDFSKFEAGKLEITNGNYKPQKMFDRIINIVNELAEKKKLEFFVDRMNVPPVHLYGDDKSISQVLMNLCSNAIKYTPQGSVTLSYGYFNQDEQGILYFKVKDTGIGIKDEDQDLVFDPFQRTDIKKNRSVQGTGLGLAITKQLVEAMGGTITLESIYGKGSSFEVRIPQTIPAGKDIMSSEDNTEAAVSSPSGPYTAPDACILAVDDNHPNLIVVKAFLKNTKIQLDTASGGIQAYEMCKQKKYDIILMDHMMPECDGIESMHMIKDDNEGKNNDTPVIILTANAIKGSENEYLDEGFDNYLSKPVDSKLLLEMIRKYLPTEKCVNGDRSG